jgi:hypothetical protein
VASQDELRDAGRFDLDSPWKEWRRARAVDATTDQHDVDFEITSYYWNSTGDIFSLHDPKGGVSDYSENPNSVKFDRNVKKARLYDELADAGQLKLDSDWRQWVCGPKRVYLHKTAGVTTLQLPKDGVSAIYMSHRLNHAQSKSTKQAYRYQYEFDLNFRAATRSDELRATGQFNPDSDWTELLLADGRRVYTQILCNFTLGVDGRKMYTVSTSTNGGTGVEQLPTLTMPENGVQRACATGSPDFNEDYTAALKLDKLRGPGSVPIKYNPESPWTRYMDSHGEAVIYAHSEKDGQVTIRNTEKSEPPPEGVREERSLTVESADDPAHAEVLTLFNNPLQLAVRTNGKAALKAVLKAKADGSCVIKLDEVFKGLTPFQVASRRGRADFVSLLAKAGCDTRARAGEKHQNATPLMLGVCSGDLKTVTVLLGLGTQELEARAEDGATAFLWACQLGKVSMLRPLVEAGCKTKTRQTNPYKKALSGVDLADEAGFGTEVRAELSKLVDERKARVLVKEARDLIAKGTQKGEACPQHKLEKGLGIVKQAVLLCPDDGAVLELERELETRLESATVEEERQAQEAEAQLLALLDDEKQAEEKARKKREKRRRQQDKKAREKQEQLEKERSAAEEKADRQAEADQLVAEQAKAERLAAEQAEAERLAVEQAEAERRRAEQAEAERLAAEQAEAEAKRRAAEQAEAERLAAEQAEAEAEAEAERVAAQQARAAEQAEAAQAAAEQAQDAATKEDTSESKDEDEDKGDDEGKDKRKREGEGELQLPQLAVSVEDTVAHVETDKPSSPSAASAPMVEPETPQPAAALAPAAAAAAPGRLGIYLQQKSPTRAAAADRPLDAPAEQDEQQLLHAFLAAQKLVKCTPTLLQYDVTTLERLLQLNETDLKGMGIAKGPRIKMLRTAPQFLADAAASAAADSALTAAAAADDEETTAAPSATPDPDPAHREPSLMQQQQPVTVTRQQQGRPASPVLQVVGRPLTTSIWSPDPRVDNAAAAADHPRVPVEPPHEFFCPISHDIMDDPVMVVATGTSEQQVVCETCPCMAPAIPNQNLQTPVFVRVLCVCLWVVAACFASMQRHVIRSRQHRSVAGVARHRSEQRGAAPTVPSACRRRRRWCGAAASAKRGAEAYDCDLEGGTAGSHRKLGATVVLNSYSVTGQRLGRIYAL